MARKHKLVESIKLDIWVQQSPVKQASESRIYSNFGRVKETRNPDSNFPIISSINFSRREMNREFLPWILSSPGFHFSSRISFLEVKNEKRISRSHLSLEVRQTQMLKEYLKVRPLNNFKILWKKANFFQVLSRFNQSHQKCFEWTDVCSKSALNKLTFLAKVLWINWRF